MKIRPAVFGDMEDLSQLNAVVQRMHAEAYPDIFKVPESDDFAMPFFTALLDDPHIYIYLAEEGEAVGYILLRVSHRDENPFMHAWDMLYIEQIGVLPKYKGKGIGKALIQQAEKLAQREELTTIGLDTWAFNADAHEFFFSQGFETFNLRMWKNYERD